MTTTTTTAETQCFICTKGKNAYSCKGCSQNFCFDHLTEHHENLCEQLNKIEDDCNLFLKTLVQHKEDPRKFSLIKQIDQWEENSINKIKQTAEESRQIIINYTNKYMIHIENKLNNFVKELKQIHDENDFNEIDLNQMKQTLIKLTEECDKLSNVSIQQNSTPFINKISLITPIDTKWKQYGITVIGGNSNGELLNHLSYPRSIFIDHDQNIYITDFGNHRIVEWRFNEKMSQIVAGGNGRGYQNNQLACPTDFIIDKENNSFIISDKGNRRVIHWSHQNNTNEQIIISDIDCHGLIMDKDGYLYVSDWKKNEVRKWKIGDKNGILVAGGNGKGNNLNQLNCPTYIFVDQDESLYISDSENDRVVKWIKDSIEGIIIAGGNGRGDSLGQLSSPQGIIVNQFGQIYVADTGNDRVISWLEGSSEGIVIVGGNGKGEKSNQFNGPSGLSFDREDNLYVVDYYNHRIQKFEIDSN